ncbi:MAG: hypothetical protein R3F34_04720 [Planctomycetota bacterium]
MKKTDLHTRPRTSLVAGLAAAAGAALLIGSSALGAQNPVANGSAATIPAPEASSVAPDQDDKEKEKQREDEFDRLYKDARGDSAKLWELYDWCEAYGMQKKHSRVLNAILKADENDRRAHELLGHEFYDGKWWDDLKKLEKYRLKKEEADAKEKGWVKYKGRWVDPKDIPYLERGLVKDEDGNWVDKEALEKEAAGWVKQDLEWISPEEKANVDKGLWKCGNSWLSLDDANTYHSELGREWRIPIGDFAIRSTLPRATVLEIGKDLQRAERDVERFFGRSPAGFHLLIVSSTDQYNGFAASADSTGASGIRGAFFADLLVDGRSGQFDGLGTALWDLGDENGPKFGRHFARYAFGISAVEALDSSPDARDAIAQQRGIDERLLGKYYAEKMLPPVLRFGFASYCDRYFVDSTAGAGGDAHWARKWSVQNIMSKGGLDPLARVLTYGFEGATDQASADAAGQLLNQAGLVVSFVLDGKCEDVDKAHAAFKEAFASGDADAIQKASKGLLDAIRKNETAYRRWAES